MQGNKIQKNFRIRKSFAKIPPVIDMPNLIDIQKQSYNKFLQADVPPEKRKNIGLQGVFKRIFPIKDYNETASLDFESYSMEKPKCVVKECRQRGITYAAPIKVLLRLAIWEKDADTETSTIKEIMEQEVYFGEIPLMTDNGTFIINGAERVVVSQLHRSPGTFFEHDKGKTHSSGKKLYSARIIPYRGSWIDFEFDARDLINVRIDRRRKLPATVLLRALGYSTNELLNYYYDTETIFLEEEKVFKSIEIELLKGQRAIKDILHPKTERVIAKKNLKFTKRTIQRIREAGITKLPIEPEDVMGKVVAKDIIDDETGEVILECNDEITEDKLDELKHKNINVFKVFFIDNLNVGSFLRDTLNSDKISTREEALIEIYRRLRPGDPPTLDTATNLFENLFFNADRYDLSAVGRLKLNFKFGLNEPLSNTILTKKDILEVVRHLIDLKNKNGDVDDIDHLGNRRVRSVGELLENQYQIGLVRMERAIKERMSLQEADTLMPHDLMNTKPVTAVIKEFFGSSQLSQFMDQTNPLSEITHKRRLSALGPGGLTRERAGFDVRDVHPTHYGRICPIETPEGPNIGLIASLSTYARVNEYGFIETPYRKVENGTVLKDVEFMSALQEENHTIAQAQAKIGPDEKFLESIIAARDKKSGEYTLVKPEEANLIDVSPNQLVSVAASLIPFLQNDDANRALMGSNMQRQAVPLLKTDAPIIGTGIEKTVARDSGVTIVAKRSGVVESVDGVRIVIRVVNDLENTIEEQDLTSEIDIYTLTKYQRSNQNTCINQKSIVEKGDLIRAGEIIADGPATEMGELALGKNVTVAFMPWGGYNFEDSILVSEKLLHEDYYTSIHIEEFECIARDTKLGPEDVTRDIPNVSEEALGELDESGIIRIGAEVKPGDILVGKITPKGETQLSPEEKLLRAIFGEKAGDVRDSSLKVPPGVVGTVISAKIFSRKGIEKDDRAKDIEDQEEVRLNKDRQDENKIIKDSAKTKICALLKNQVANASLIDSKKEVLIAKDTTLHEEMLADIPLHLLKNLEITKASVKEKIPKILESMTEQLELVELVFNEKITRLKKGDELPPGVIKMVKVYVAIKRKLAVGDKMAGRHGNKGVISRILPEQDMPYTADGIPVDIVLNPLGVPSRMNVGQILETHLGWAAHSLGKQLAELAERGMIFVDKMRDKLKQIFVSESIHEFIEQLNNDEVIKMCRKLKKGIHFETPVFDGATEEDIRHFLGLAGLSEKGQTTLYDGISGEAFDSDITLGTMYVFKLHHLVDDKIHARSIGPYSLVTQQPLGGKAQFGGQRLGEMEVWAMEAYGAAYSLQEFLTVKSDDVSGRTKTYESIVKGKNTLEAGLPESFNVLIKELQSLALDVSLI